MKLPPTMRLLGDTYVRKEFRMHYKPHVNPHYRRVFLREWKSYLRELSMQAAVVGRDVSQKQLSKLNANQKEKLTDLKQTAREMARRCRGHARSWPSWPRWRTWSLIALWCVC